jgi:hypothetical protein
VERAFTPFRVFFALTFSDGFGADHPNVTVTALGGASADNVMPANISDISGLVSSGRLPIDIVLLQASGPDETGRYNAGSASSICTRRSAGRAVGHRAGQPGIAVDPRRHGDRAGGDRCAGAGRRVADRTAGAAGGADRPRYRRSRRPADPDRTTAVRARDRSANNLKSRRPLLSERS